MKEIIKVHSLILLNLYGVKEKLIQKNPEALNSFVELLDEEFNQEKQKLIKEIEKYKEEGERNSWSGRVRASEEILKIMKRIRQ